MRRPSALAGSSGLFAGLFAGLLVGLLVGLAAGFLAGCTDDQPVDQVIELGNVDDYGELVQPYVGVRCGSLDCHGDSGRPLRIYAQDGLRLRDDLRETDITVEEIARNVEAFAGVSPDIAAPDEHLALLKGLATSAGGIAHEGDDIWQTTGETGYQCILAWLAGNSQDQAARDACIAAFDEVAPVPAE